MASQNPDDISSTNALTQENYELRRQLEIARQMEAEYLDEIEQLKRALETNSEQSVKVHADPDKSMIIQLEDRAQIAEAKVVELQMELCSSQQKLAQVQDKLATAEFRLDTRNLEVFSHKSDQDDLDRTALVEQVSRLNEELAHVRAQHHFDVGRLERQLVEAEEDRSALQCDLAELERHLKEARLELSDARAQLEAVELQSNCTAETRGNSAFSEVEDRRIRAERLVLQQRQMIEELKLELERVQAESKRRLLSEVQKLEVRYRERDTKFTDNLVAERERLQAENRALTLQLQQLEELQLDDERRAVKTSKAFDFEGNKQEGFIKTLEQRISVLKHRLTDKTNLIDGLRDQVIKSNLLVRKMQSELWQQSDLTSRLTEQVNYYKKQLNSTTEAPQPLKSVQLNNHQTKESTTKKDSLLDAADQKQHSVLPTGKLNREFFANFENEAPPNDSAAVAVPATTHSKLSSDLEKQNVSQRSKTKQSELPSECKTS